MLRIAVLDDYQRVARDYGNWASLGSDIALEIFDHNLATMDDAAAELAPFDVICLMRERMAMPAALIDRLPNAKLIITTGVRNPSLDIAAAAARGVTVAATRGGESLYATSELAWALVLATQRHIPAEERRMRDGGWQQSVGTVLHGKTLSLLGLGKLGARMVPVAKAFGMETIAWSPNLDDERAEAAGTMRVMKEDLFANADILSIHLVLSANTRGIVGSAELGRMKSSATLINTSRGPLVDETALIAALREKRIKGAGLDVYDVEPPPRDHALRSLDNVVLSPHLGYVTEGTYRQFFADMVENIATWRAGAPLRVLTS